MAGLTLDILANTRQAQAQVKDLGEALDDVGDALDDVARDSQKDARTVERSLDGIDRAAASTADEIEDIGDASTDMARETDRAGDKVEKTFRDLMADAKKADSAVKDMGSNSRASLGNVAEGAQEVQNEIGQNMAQAFSSFRGEMEDVAQIGQDTLGGLAGTLASTGPAGIVGAIGLAGAAAGWGIMAGHLEAQTEAAEKLRERLSGAYKEAAEAGRDYLSTAQIVADAQDLIFNPERADEYKALQEEAKMLRLDEATLIKANSGDLTAQKIIQQEITALIAENTRTVYLNGAAVEELNPRYDRLRGKWEGIAQATHEQQEAARRSQQVTSDFLLDAARKAETASSAVDELGNELLTLPDGTEIVIDAKTKQAHQDLDRFYGDADGKIEELNRKDITLKLDVDDRALKSFKPPVIQGKVIYNGTVGTRQML